MDTTEKRFDSPLCIRNLLAQTEAAGVAVAAAAVLAEAAEPVDLAVKFGLADETESIKKAVQPAVAGWEI